MFKNNTIIKSITKSFNATLTKVAIGISLFAVSFSAEAQSISISSPVSSVVEGASSTITYVISIDGGGVNTTGAAITGSINYSGTATDGADFVGIPSFSIPIGASSTTIVVTVIDDLLIEATETVIATISNVVGGTVGNNGSSTTSIYDDDSGSLFISIGSPVDAVEGSSNISFEISIVSGGPSAMPITGNISFTGTAVSTVDYMPVTSFTIPAGASSTTLSIIVLDDALTEPTESVVAILSGSPSIGAYANTSSTAYILDDDAASIIVSIGSPVDGAEGGANVSYTVFLENGMVNGTGSDIYGSINYSGTATNAADYVSVANFAIPNGQSSTILSIPVIDDGFIECNEIVIATIANTNVGTIGTASSTASIIDDECSQVFISIGSPVDGTEGSSNITYTIFIEGGGVNTTGSAITGTISYAGAASNPADFIPVPNFSIPPGANSTTITIVIIDDALTEPTESVIASLTGSPSMGAYSNTSSTAYILDDDAGSLSVSIDPLMDGAEGVSDARFVVSLDFGNINGTGSDIYGIVNYSGTATSSDFSGIMLFSIPNGAWTDTLLITITDDILVELTETVIATISTVNVGTIGNGMASINIIDNDLSSMALAILAPIDGTEGSSDVSFIVAIDGGLVNGTGSDISGSISYSGTATSGLDFSSAASTFSIPDGASIVTVSIPVIDDLLPEPTESIIATISAPSAGTIGTSSVDTAYIYDNDSTTSINEIDFSDINLSLYPNPTKGIVVIEADEQINGVEMVDLQGRTVQSWETSAKKVNVNITGSAEGYYIFTVMLNDGRFVTRKVLKE